jgi:hypothetical protein
MPQRTTTRVSRTSICAHVAEFEAIVAVQTNVQSFVKRAALATSTSASAMT